MFFEISVLPLRGFVGVAGNFVGGRRLFFHRAGDGVLNVVNLLMILLIWSIAFTAAFVSVWMASILPLMSSVAAAVCLASSLTSLATTAKPLPASPARAASMVAFKASKFVCCAMLVITLMTLADLDAALAELGHVLLVSAATLTASVATLAASVRFWRFPWRWRSFLRTGGHGRHVLADLFGSGRHHVGLGGRFLGI